MGKKYKLLINVTCIHKEDNENITFLYRVMRLDSSKGKKPAIKTKSITPHDHRSALAPS